MVTVNSPGEPVDIAPLMPEPTEPLGKGVWCHGCDWFENDERDGDMCVGCGCPTEDHVDAQVVAIVEP